MAASSPLIQQQQLADPMVCRQTGMLTVGDYLAHVEALAQRLPDVQYLFNCCEDRYAFMVAFGAALLRGQTNLMPPSRAPEIIREIASDYPDCAYLSDEAADIADVHCLHFQLEALAIAERANIPEVPMAHTAALVFTSGSTGRPKPNPKSWRSLVLGTQMAAERFFGALDARPHILATVPPQHMYGLETTVLHALLSGAVMHAGRPLFPEDVRAALDELPTPRVLVTTPIHLRAFVKSGLTFPSAAFIISATAPLDRELAEQAESLFEAPLLEIYGCTEAGSMASRRSLEGERWRLYPGMRLKADGNTTVVNGPQLAQSVPLGDIIEQFDDGQFALRGRNTDMLNIAGKRASLADLNQRLLAIEGVEDGVILQPEEGAGPVTRLAALVVAPAISEEAILQALRAHTDAVFLPRPLYKVDSLPRNETGKLPRKTLMALLRQQESTV